MCEIICEIIEFIRNNFSGFATISAALIAGYIADKYQKGNLDIVREKLEKDLFTEFNKRYDELNDSLSLLTVTMTIDELKDVSFNIKDKTSNIEGKKLHNVVVDYFNLCAEQYYWYKNDRVSKEIWEAWHAGMMYYYKQYPVVRELWKEETKEEGFKSYYLSKSESFFTNTEI